MGVPKFFCYISERYPCLSELVREFQMPDFDNLYLDMNGIIHACSHPQDADLNFSIKEETIFASIFHYIEVLFNMIKPKKLFFLAVDGVAPRAKMNQQRARRFRSAKDAEMLRKNYIREYNKEPPKERFDSNCITPGTVFMGRLHSFLKYFITSKISSDPLWQQCKIILSGHETPGEGEHKIMDYIRYMKTLPDYDPNTRHCLYGLDADLVMLGLCTHEPHFSLLREKVQFGNKIRKKITSPDETEFYLLNLSLMREYIDLEFQELKSILPFEFNLENIIDDWVLMGFLVGNDFIPHLPGLHINKGALPMLYKTYKEVLPTLDGYLNENGYLNLPRFQAYMEKLGEHDIKVFEETYANLAFLEGKMGKVDAEEVKPKDDESKKSDLEELIKATNDLFLDGEEDEFLEDDNETFFMEFRQHKKDYYTNKLDYSNVTEEVLKSQAEGYIRAIQWNLHYYYQGCQSWSWYYPHHYAPYISDIKNFKDLKLDFEMGKPFLPFEQLLAVLPVASKNLLPSVYDSLMTSPESPIKDFYPEDFETDLNGKTQEWEAVVLIPFIDEKRLLEAMKPYNEKLSKEERRRNSHGPMHIFTYTEENLGIYKCEEYFPSILSNHASMVDVDVKDILVDKSQLKFGLRPGVSLDVYFPGFPTFRHIPFTAALKVCKLKVFSWLTSGDNMIITVTKRGFPHTDVLAKDYLGKIVYVNWPHLLEARVTAVVNKEFKYTLLADGGVEKAFLDKEGKSRLFEAGCSAVVEHYFKRLGIELGDVEVLIYAAAMEGHKYISDASGKMEVEKVWSKNPSPHPLQVVVKDIKVCELRTRPESEYKDIFRAGSKVFMLSRPYFGSMGTVVDSQDCYSSGRVKVSFEFSTDPVLSKDIFELESRTLYLPCRVAATKVGVTPKVLAHITGCIFIGTSDGSKMTNFNTFKVNIGLNLKHNFKNEELPGYTRKENDIWLYSTKAINLACSYVESFPHVIEYLSEHQNKNDFLMQDLFPGPEGEGKTFKGPAELLKVITWIKQQDFNRVTPIKVGSRVLESETVSKIAEIVDEFTPYVTTRIIHVKPRYLYKSDLVSGNVPPVPDCEHRLFDRVVSIRSSYTVPAGLKGFIIGKHIARDESEIIYDVLFDKPFVGASTVGSARERVFHMLRNSFLNLTESERSQGKALVTLKPVLMCLETQVKQKPVMVPGDAPLIPLVEKPLQFSTSGFIQWMEEERQEEKKAKPSTPEKKNDDHFKELWQNLQSPKPSEETDVLKKMLKIGDEKTKSPAIEEPVKSFFEKVSTSAKTVPPMNSQNGIKNGILSIIQSDNQPLNRYCVQLLSYYQRRYLGHPRYNYTYLGNKIIAQIQMRDGRVFSGLPCDEKVSASESAALHALVSLGQIPLNGGEDLILKRNENQVPTKPSMPVNPPGNPPMNLPVKRLTNVPVNAPSKTCAKENHQQGHPPARNGVENNWREENRNVNQRQHVGNNNLPFPIPPPPSQWVGPSRNVIKSQDPCHQSVAYNAGFPRGTPNRPHEPPRPPTTGSRVQAAALGFVPLQAITGIRNVGVIPPNRNSRTKTSPQPAMSKPDSTTANVPPSQGGSSKPLKPKRKPRIAANLALDQNLY